MVPLSSCQAGRVGIAMKIVISAHFDLAHPVMAIKLDKSHVNGLVDNFAGMLAAYQASRRTGVEVYFTNFEELEYDGAIDVAKKLDKDTIVIVLDTIKETDIMGKKVSLANVYGFETDKLKIEFETEVHFIDGYFEETEDETWIYGKKFGLKTCYFGIPIPNDYHDVDNTVSLQTIDQTADILVRVIQHFQASEY
jgi:putative aminopeptidase FrvX